MEYLLKIFYKMWFWFFFFIFTIIKWWNNGFEAERNPGLKVELKVKCQDEMIDVILVYRVPCLENSGGEFWEKLSLTAFKNLFSGPLTIN